jgi:hypothetical protein
MSRLITFILICAVRATLWVIWQIELAKETKRNGTKF